MSYTIKSIQFYVRETKPARFPSALGKAALANQPPKHVTSPLCHARVVLKDDRGTETFGCSADRLSVRWLDKRPGRSIGQKRRELTSLLHFARETYLRQPAFQTPFDIWNRCHGSIMKAGREQGQEDLTSSFASALLERAVIDGVCRAAGEPFFLMLKSGGLGLDVGRIHPELRDVAIADVVPPYPVTTIKLRHTVGIFDPLTEEDWPEDKRLDDGLPETVQDYIQQQGIHYFKVKISGDVDADIERLARLWEILPFELEPAITLDANEAFDDLERFELFVKRLEEEQLGMFQHILFIEQPLRRQLALDASAAKLIRRIGKVKPLVIDESDGTLSSFKRAVELGYSGTSHKNCKGVFKSLTNLALAAKASEQAGHELLLSGEDLQNLPVVPLQQDLVTVGTLGLEHCERNGHHYNFGLSMLSEQDKERVTKRHPDLYERRGDEWFLRIRDGHLSCDSLHGPGFGVQDEPDWSSMTALDTWLDQRHPA